jgi:hypothetical protein
MTDYTDTVPGTLDDIKARVGRLEQAVAENTELTRDVRDMLTAGRVMVKAAKVAGALAAAGSALWIAVYQITHGGHPPGR